MTVQEQSTNLPILLLTPKSGGYVCACAERKMRPARGKESLQGRQRRFKIFSPLSAQTHFSPLHCRTDMQMGAPQNAEHQISFNLFLAAHSLALRSPHSPPLSLSFSHSLCSSRRSVFPPPSPTLPPLCIPAPPSLHSAFFALSCLVLARALARQLQGGERISLHATS